MIVTKIAKEDYPQVLAIYNHYILNTTATFEKEALSLATFKTRIEKICQDYPFLVLKENDKVLGYAYLSAFNEREAYDITCDLSLYLAHDQCAKGLGSILWTHIKQEALSLGKKNIISLITLENEASLAFHQKQGFKEVGRLLDVGQKFDRYLSVAYYQYCL
ncbi:MAG: N-acetyltransferase family protein [Erysipelotrichaceae bacterium]|nr:N-acetyltransferase family protein [Erysipelotrichaceae bacterium]